MADGGDPFGARMAMSTSMGEAAVHWLGRLQELGLTDLSALPYSIRVLLESLLRNCGGPFVSEDDVRALAAWGSPAADAGEVPFIPTRVILQDFTGVPAVVDLAAMRSAVHRMGGDPSRINPVVPADLVIDHSVQVDRFATPDSLEHNERMEYARNTERYALLRWAQTAFDNLRVAPPAKGICHQVNLEHLASVVHLREVGGKLQAFPDTLVGTDSHTTMINGLGVVGWGVGGIEAEAVMLGQPYYMPVPEVVGFRLVGGLREGVTATDLVLTVTRILRRHGVVGRFVEFFGPGVRELSLPDRATISNMSPEYGATMGYFPVDEETLRYLRGTGRSAERVALVRAYLELQGLMATPGAPEPRYTETLELDLATVGPTLAGPKRPQDSIPLADMAMTFDELMGGSRRDRDRLDHGSVVIAAITSCTNTSNPSVLVAAGLMARNAVERGLASKPWVKTSMAPGSRVVTDYLNKAGLLPYLERLGFHVVGYGCTTCIGNSGPLPKDVAREVEDRELTVAAVLSGNRNFEGRVNPHVKAAYLASPPLVVAYALAGTVDIDLANEPLGTDTDGGAVFLRDIWPSDEEVRKVIDIAIEPQMYLDQYSVVMEGTELWDALDVPEGVLYEWDEGSTYIREPPFFADLAPALGIAEDIIGARALALLGDSITTDHISPAGAIPGDGPAGRYLVSRMVAPEDFNSFGSRRGNHEVMLRGTFANIRLRNMLAPGTEGGWTRHLPSEELMSMYDAATRYMNEGTPLVVIGGREYGSGSSRDWAAKGTQLLGVRAVIAESYERIHRSNLVGMGVLPLEFREGEGARSLGLTGEETIDILGVGGLAPGGELTVVATDVGGARREFPVTVRLNSPVEVAYWRNGGILHKFIKDMMGTRGSHK